MRVATLHDGTPDGRLVVGSPDGSACAPAPFATLQAALENWAGAAPQLAAITAFPEPLDPEQIIAPLPRAWQWRDGSAYQSHGDLVGNESPDEKQRGYEQPRHHQPRSPIGIVFV
ncbi:MAG: hypothetical protein ACKVOL_05945 [Novosphingobium sp.]